MAKAKSVYSCTECGGQSPKWQGQCPHCDAWNTLIETAAEPVKTAGTNRFASLGGSGEVVTLGDVKAKDFPRMPTLIGEFDRVLGGGIVGTNAGDLIAEVALAVEMGADAADVGLTIHPHPTLSESVGLSAEAFEGTLTDLYIPRKSQ